MSRKLLIATAVMAIVNGLIWFGYIPYLGEKVATELGIYKTAREKTAGPSLANFQDIYKAKERLGEFEKRLREKKDMPRLISYLFEQAGATRVDILNITYNFEERKDEKLTKVTFAITLEGKYEDMRKFMYSLENGSHFFEISGVKLSRQTENITANVQAASYLKGI